MSFLGLIFRTLGAWGAGKGSNLTAAEVDGNFYAIDQAFAALDADPPTAVSISNVTQSGSNITVWLSDGSSFGPFPLPTASPLIPVKTIADDEYTLLLADRGNYIRCTAENTGGGCVVNVPSDGELLFPTGTEFYFRQVGGAISFECGTDTVIHGVTGFLNETGGQGATAMLKKVAADEWDLCGLLAAAP